MKTWGSAPCCVPEHAPESGRVDCTEQEFLPGVVTKALKSGPELPTAPAAQGYPRLQEAVSETRQAIWRGLQFHISGDELLPSSLTAAFCKSLQLSQNFVPFPPRFNTRRVLLCPHPSRSRAGCQEGETGGKWSGLMSSLFFDARFLEMLSVLFSGMWRSFRMSLVEGANALTINVLRVSAVTEKLC